MGDDAAPLPADSEVLQLRTENQSLKDQIAKLTDVAARSQADLLNFKDRMKREGDELRKFAVAPLLLGLLPIRDDVARMVEHVPSDGGSQLLAKIDALLKSCGVTPIPSIGLPSNPDQHEIITMGPGKADTIIAVHEEGFLLHGRVLRPAKVTVGDGSDPL